MPRHYSKKTKKQSGGAASSPNSDNFTQKDVEKFFEELIKQPLGGYFAHNMKAPLSKDFFEVGEGSRHGTTLKPKWKKMVNECYNSRGQTPLYVALRFGAHHEIISILLKNINDVNRPNKTGVTDESTPLIGLCFGKTLDSKINFNDVSSMINLICSTYNGDLNKANTKDETPYETPLIILQKKSTAGLLEFTK